MTSQTPTDAFDPWTYDPFEAALEGGSQALVQLQLILRRAGDEPDVKDHAQRAIASLRAMLWDVRRACGREGSALAYGLVIAAGEPGLDYVSVA